MTPNVNDWFRSLGIFGTAFAAVVVLTMGLAGAIVPTGAGGSQGGDAPGAPAGPSGSPHATPAPATTTGQLTTVGGTLAVTGDREGGFVLERETTENRYGLVGPDGRILFEGGEVVTVARVQYDGLEFFVDPDECTVIPGERHDASGVAGADIDCPAIEDVRGNGVIGLAGRVGVAADLFGLRGDLPATGGTGRLGEVELTFAETRISLPTFQGAFAGQLHDVTTDTRVALTYDPMSHALSVSEVEHAGDTAPIPPGGCDVSERQIGMLNPHVRVVELTVRCDAVELPELGTVPLDVSVIAELAEPPR